MRYKLGISMENYSNSQAVSYAIMISHLIKQHPEQQLDMTIFARHQIDPVSIPHCSILSQKEMWAYDGTVIATDLISAEDLILSPRPTKKYFYVINLEWIYMYNTYRRFADIYMHDQLQLIARSPIHANIITRMWKPPYCTISHFTYKDIQELL